MTAASPILSDAEVERLWAEHDRLSELKRQTDARLDEICHALTASGEAKLAAIRELEADLEAGEL